MSRVVNCVTDCVWLTVPQATEWQRIGNQIKAEMIFTELGEAAGWGEAAVFAQLSASALLWAWK
jgi:hypothetical protein